MKLKLHNIEGDVTGEVDVADAVFAAEIRPHLHWEVVRWQQAKKRAGTHTVKGRHDVNGTTQRMFRQKGTGRARHGSSKAHIFVGGGVAFGPQQRSYAFKVNRKTRKNALRSILSYKAANDQVRVVENFELAEIKTRVAKSALDKLGCRKALVIDGDNHHLSRSVRNLPYHDYLHVAGLNAYDLLNHDEVILTQAALTEIEGRLSS